MHNDHSHLDEAEDLQKILPVCPAPRKAVVSPLGWSIKSRLLCAAAASTFLWLSVAWAIGWLQ